jgi:hypothetical protein
MINKYVILLIIWVAFIAMSFWESSVEGRNAGNRAKQGFKIKLFSKNWITRYHFFLFYVMIPIFIYLPLIIYGWNFELFGVLLSAHFSGIVIEDFVWFLVNPQIKIKQFNPKFVNYYPWLKFGKKIYIPLFYIVDLSIAIMSWLFIWT